MNKITPVGIDKESRMRIPLPQRRDLDPDAQKIFDYFTSGTKGVLRGLHGPAGIWLHEPKLIQVYVPFGNYLRFHAGLSEPVREACVLAMARECNNAFEWAAHEPEALEVGVPPDVIESIKFRKPTAAMAAPFGTVVELIREAFTERSVTAATYNAAVSLEYPFLSTSSPLPGPMQALRHCSQCLICSWTLGRRTCCRLLSN
jgi:4-carboxymuconolactone decarboxylase